MNLQFNDDSLMMLVCQLKCHFYGLNLFIEGYVSTTLQSVNPANIKRTLNPTNF